MKKVNITEAFANQIAESPADQLWVAGAIHKKTLDEDSIKEKFQADFDHIDEETEPEITIEWDKLVTMLEDAKNPFTAFFKDLNESINDINIEGLDEAEKVKTIGVFETYFGSIVGAYAEKLDEGFEERVEEVVEERVAEINEEVEVDLREWAEEKAEEIQTYIKRKADSQIVEDVKAVLVKHGVDIDDESQVKRDELEEKITSLEEDIAEKDRALLEYKKEELRATKKDILVDISEGMTDLDKAKLLKLSEGVRFVDEDQYKEEVKTLKSTFLGRGKKSVDEDKDDTVQGDSDKRLAEAREQFKAYMSS